MHRWLTLVQFNVRHFTYKQWLCAIAAFCLSTFFTILYYGGHAVSLLDAFIYHFSIFGGADFIIVIHTLLPFLILAFFVDLYTENNLNDNLLYTLLRVTKINLWASSHLAVLFAMHVVFLGLYYAIAWVVLPLFYEHGAVTVLYWTETASLDHFYPVPFVLLFSLLIQVSGAFGLSLWQLYVNALSQRVGYGYLSVVLIYLLAFIFPLKNVWIGSHVTLEKYGVLAAGSGEYSVAIFFAVHTVWIVLFISLLCRLFWQRKF